MKNISRITFFILVLVGGAFGFRYWAISNFNSTLSNFDNLTATVNVPVHTLTLENQTISDEPTPEIPTEDSNIATPIPTTLPIPKLTFSFPSKGIDVYEGCKYTIAWTATSPINSIDMALADSGTQQVSGPVLSGISKNITQEDVKSYEWKVGNVWPGAYHLFISNINGEVTKKNTYTFNIKKIPDDVDDSNIEEFCKNSI